MYVRALLPSLLLSAIAVTPGVAQTGEHHPPMSKEHAMMGDHHPTIVLDSVAMVLELDAAGKAALAPHVDGLNDLLGRMMPLHAFDAEHATESQKSVHEKEMAEIHAEMEKHHGHLEAMLSKEQLHHFMEYVHARMPGMEHGMSMEHKKKP